MITNTEPHRLILFILLHIYECEGNFFRKGSLFTFSILEYSNRSSTKEMFHISIIKMYHNRSPTNDSLKIKNTYCRTSVENIELLKQQVDIKILSLFMITLLSSSKKKEIVSYLLQNCDKLLMDLIQSVDKYILMMCQ